MNRIQEIDAIVAQFDLNGHNFYQAWRTGQLPMAKLTDYAGEYGKFVDLVDRAWDTLGEAHYAQEERAHAVMWQKFLVATNHQRYSDRPQTDALVASSRSLFSGTPAVAAGALYAFEAQQPQTSASKLAGLQEHYQIVEEAHEYFAVHAHDVAEAENLRDRFLAMSDAEFAQAKGACAVICAALWAALDGVYYTD